MAPAEAYRGRVSADRTRSGILAGFVCYCIWGLFPAYFPLLEPASPTEILAHRVVWTLLVMLVVLAATGRLRALRGLDRRTWLVLCAAAVFISVNWGVYVYTVNSSRVSEAALGYFINPLVSVLLGVALFSERLLRPQKIAVGIAVVAVAVLTVGYGHFPYLSITLALSFGMYGVMKKTVGVPATVSLTAEVVLTAPLALAYLLWLGHTGRGTFTSHGAGHALLLASAGLVTALPLLLFGVAAQRIPLALVGMLQYVTPVLQLTWAVVAVGEHLDGMRWAGFALVLVAVLLFSGSQLAARGRAARPVTGGVADDADRVVVDP